MQLAEEHKPDKMFGSIVEAPLACADLENSSMFSPTGNPRRTSSAGGPTLNHITMDGLPMDPNARQLVLMQYQYQPGHHTQALLHDSAMASCCYTPPPPGTLLVPSQMPGQMIWPHGDGTVRDLCSHLDSLACPAHSSSAPFPPDFLYDATNTAYDPFTFAPAMDLAFYHHGQQPSAIKQSQTDMEGDIMPPQTTPACEASTTVRKIHIIIL